MARTMADPVTNVEIEDVLSSIRRLVSEEDRSPRGAQRPVPERLVLSPALRVPDEVEPEPPVTLAGQGRAPQAPMLLSEPSVAPVTYTPPTAEADADATLVLGAEDSISQTDPDMADAADLADAQDDGVDPLTADTADLHLDLLPEDELTSVDAAILADDPQANALLDGDSAEAAVDDTEAGQIAALRASLTDILVRDRATGADGALELADDPDDLAGPDPADLPADLPVDDAADVGPDTELDRKIATLELMLAHQSRDWTAPTPPADLDVDPLDQTANPAPDAPVAVDGADPAPLAEDDDADTDAALQAAVAAVAHAASDTPATDADETDQPPEMTAAMPGDDIADVPDHSAEGYSPDDHTPDDDSPEAPDASAVPGNARPAFVRHAPTEALDWEDHAPAATPQPDPVPEAQPDHAAAVSALSEEALQAVVSEIVRQELQGALGERITRNVRKLVRREIHRVLMSKDLD